MKTSYTLFIHILLLLLIASCGDDPASPNRNNPNLVSQNIGSDGGSITAKDQRLTLTIPAGALGNNETITIEEINSDDLGSEFDPIVDELGVEKVYNLGPDGMEFDNPIVVSFKSNQLFINDADSMGVFAEFLFTSSNGSVEALQNISTSSGDDGMLIIKGQLSHFSPLVTSQANNGVSFFVFNVPESMNVGDTFTASAQIYKSLAGPLGNIVSVTGQAKYEDESGVPIQPTFNPTTADIPGNPDDGYKGNFEYTCTAVGTGIYGSELSVRVRFDLDSGPVFATSFAPYLTTITCEEPPPAMFALTIEKEGDGNVENEGADINCGEDCSAEFLENTNVTLMAKPDEGWIFSGWSGDIPEECEDSTDDCIVNMNQNRTVKATFVQEPKKIHFADPTICIEHGTNQSKLLWLWEFEESLGYETEVTMRIKLPNGTTKDVVFTSTAQAKVLFALLTIFTYGNYQWEIVMAVDLDTGEILLDEGTTQGEINVNAQEQNAGKCD